MDLAKIRKRLENQNGKRFWRSLEELAETEEFQRLVENEFPQSPPFLEKPFSRRKFLKIMGASMALAGLTACTRQPTEKIFPYVRAPEEIVPGKPLFFATGFTLGGYATGVLVESHMGRPTKIEGNLQHPASLGATDAFAQASVLELYDPDRSQVIKNRGRISTWEQFLADANAELEKQRLVDGAGLRILTETVTSPTLADQITTLLSEFPLAKWHQYEPVGRDNAKAGAQMAFGEMVDTQFDFEKANVILSLDADFLTSMPGSPRYTRQFSARRQVDETPTEMNRLYVVESTPTLTGAMADHRLALRPGDVLNFAIEIAKELQVFETLGISPADIGLESVSSSPSSEPEWRTYLQAVVKDLKRQRGSGLVVASEQQPPIVHFLAHAINSVLDNIGESVLYTDPVEVNPVIQRESIRELVDDMVAGSVELLLILGGNPVFNAPADLNFAENMARVNTRIHLSLYDDETSELCHWHLPQAHYLETWSDARAFDGTVSILQPLIAPLYGGRSAHEVLAVFLDQPGKSSHDIVREHWQKQRPLPEFEKFWRKSLHDGLVAGTAFQTKTPDLKLDTQNLSSVFESSTQRLQSTQASKEGLDIAFKPDPTIWDGRYANNGWLQELPKPLTKLTWDNAALISPKTAEQRNLKNEDVIEIRYRDRVIDAPVWILPGQPENTVSVHFGYGRKRSGQLGTSAGFNAYSLRTSQAPWFDSGIEIKPTGKRVKLASTQDHHSMENRHLVRAASLEEYIEHPEFAHELGHDPPRDMTLYPEYQYEGYSWGMTIDLNACIGCNACTVACQAENNIPVVGKEEVQNGREMHWIRVDRYYEGDLDVPETHHQPVPCMHCENAPCEVVCPVVATVHSDEGLNEMVYNRCVGTRYCSNNCPYKVRRFNFYQYSDWKTPSLKLQKNPDVTVRSRGVMEKCTYCVQRINYARIEAKKEDRQIRDGEIQTACQQVCPAEAIVFGDINNPESQVAKRKADARNYGILTGLNTRPRTTYLAKIKNLNPEFEEA